MSMEEGLLKPEEQVVPAVEESVPEQEKKYCKCLSKKKLILLIVGCVVGVLLLIVLVGFLIQYLFRPELPGAIEREGIQNWLDKVVVPLGKRSVDDDVVQVVNDLEQGVLSALGEYADKVKIDKQCITMSNVTESDGEGASICSLVVDTLAGLENSVVVIGAHFDSAPNSPGMNDNGVGVAALIEIMVKFFKINLDQKVVNRVQFAWWSGQKLGNVGSSVWLNKYAKKENIVAYIDIDQIASVNHVLDITNPESLPAYLHDGAAIVMDSISKFYKLSFKKVEKSLDPINADVTNFHNAGIVAVGVRTFSPTHETKTEEQAKRYGGTAGEPYDPCQDKPCDDMSNINMDIALFETKAVATGIETLAMKKNLRNALYPRDAMQKRLQVQGEGVQANCKNYCSSTCYCWFFERENAKGYSCWWDCL